MALTNARAETRLPARDLDRARRWYRDKLGLQPSEERPGGLRYTTASGVFCVFQSVGASDGGFTQLCLEVDDLAAEMAALRERGVVFHDYALASMTTTDGVVRVEGNYPSKGVGELGAWFTDSEGNLISLGQAL